jgi:two-component system cell cycle response regulator DivK
MNQISSSSSAQSHDVLALLVDRDTDTRAMYAQYLRLAACDIAEAEDGPDALAKALSRHPDVIVTETRLSGIDGYQLCSLLRHDPTTHSIPIVVVTGDAFPADVERARKAGADAVLVKPCLPERLLVEMRRVLETSAELRQHAHAVRTKLSTQLTRAERAMERSRETMRNYPLSRAYNRHTTTTPAVPPPALICPVCDHSLAYLRSHVGGVSERHAEQWDYFECPAGCGTFQYRQRTRKLRRVF